VAPAAGGGIGLGFVVLLLGAVVTVLLTLLTRQGVRAEIAARELAGMRERERRASATRTSGTRCS
jgi:hypothetical protein